MADSLAKSSTYAAWFSAVVSLCALGISLLSYLKTIEPEKLDVRFRYVTISLGADIDDPLAKLRAATSDQVAVVENSLFPEMAKAIESYQNREEDDFSAPPEFSFLVIENVSSAYFESVQIDADLLKLTDIGAYADNPNSSQIVATEITNSKLNGIKAGEFIAFPTRLKSTPPCKDRFKVKTVSLNNESSNAAKIKVREELEVKVDIQGTRTGH